MPALADPSDGMATRAVPCEKSLAAVEGGYVRGSSSGSKEARKTPSGNSLMRFSRVTGFSPSDDGSLMAESVGIAHDLNQLTTRESVCAGGSPSASFTLTNSNH